jgi:hypothetical protein
MFCRKETQYVTDVFDKTKVKHMVRLIQHQDVQATQIYMSLVSQVEHTARCGNQDVHTLIQLPDLRFLVHPTY